MSWTPDETPAELWLDRISLIGAELADVAYGVHVTLFFLCFNAWWSARRHSPRGAYSTIAFISCIFVLGSVGIAASMRIQQLAYIDDSNFPGGPGAFESVSGYMKINVFGFSAYTVNAWFADGLLLYRFYILWSTSRHRWAVIPPFLAYLLSIISSSILLAQMAVPGGALWLSTNANMALTFWSASISVTCYCTLGIIIKLLYMRYQVRKAFGGGEQLPYFSVAAMLIESALLYVAFALAFLVTYALSNRISFMLISILGQAQVSLTDTLVLSPR
ncbi:uncharacterized protein PHACADRAFT_155352 [Phanerochaete carnosa HHB-10118-sp]|uniref:Uncharacterized protein n=1 Tax=Phanerochaete carnosa (strain HHB-10118-sp) TaxID=650164 RepID=K5VAA8_PHACS|nr:uncharacterized protein PHACADRAFT_155352 [Phanerochaete carnosa HHB-10118-sp]EKM48023.1 hypothetical protein PHACADRAFT_155352 [Phanerochaete carnosa HHB-10118-sp]